MTDQLPRELAVALRDLPTRSLRHQEGEYRSIRDELAGVGQHADAYWFACLAVLCRDEWHRRRREMADFERAVRETPGPA